LVDDMAASESATPARYHSETIRPWRTTRHASAPVRAHRSSWARSQSSALAVPGSVVRQKPSALERSSRGGIGVPSPRLRPPARGRWSRSSGSPAGGLGGPP
jgi:hypothetical protein